MTLVKFVIHLKDDGTQNRGLKKSKCLRNFYKERVIMEGTDFKTLGSSEKYELFGKT